MLIYCSKCNNLIGKINDQTLPQGAILERKCNRCCKENRYYVQYKAVIDRNGAKLTESEKNAIMQ